MVYLTGDTHGDFLRISDFCETEGTTTDDVLVILGDAGINFFGEPHDRELKEQLAEFPITLFCIHGNHEMRPETIDTYEEIKWRGGLVYREYEYPNLLFAKDGEIYKLEDKRCIAIGGAYSVDKYYRLLNGDGWWPDEQPSDEIKDRVERRLDKAKWRVDAVFSHTCPYKYIPREVFIPGINKEYVDNSTEEWLDEIEEKLDYSQWYCGHFHTDKNDGLVWFLFEEYRELL